MEPNYLNSSNIDPASIRPGQLDHGALTKEHIREAINHLRKQGTTPLLLGSAIVYETTYYSLAADMYKEVIRGLASGKVFEDKHTPGKMVKGFAVWMGYINNIHIIEVYGVIEKLPETEHEPRANDRREYPQKPTSGLIEEE